jgi:hypothetical protein
MADSEKHTSLFYHNILSHNKPPDVLDIGNLIGTMTGSTFEPGSVFTLLSS